MTTATGDLPDTLTYHDRRWFFMGRTEPVDGVLIIGQMEGKAEKVFRYFVEEQPPQPGIMGRSFLLVKQDAPPNGGETLKNMKDKPDHVYQTIIGPMNWCRCTAGRTSQVKECKHVTACLAMIANGVI